jgi:hypothetical protein
MDTPAPAPAPAAPATADAALPVTAAPGSPDAPRADVAARWRDGLARLQDATGTRWPGAAAGRAARALAERTGGLAERLPTVRARLAGHVDDALDHVGLVRKARVAATSAASAPATTAEAATPPVATADR